MNQGAFTTRWYNDPVLDNTGRETGETTPVWSIPPESLIVSPAPDEAVPRMIEREIWGWAWADGGVSNVYVATEETAKWQIAEIEAPRERGRRWRKSVFSLRSCWGLKDQLGLWGISPIIILTLLEAWRTRRRYLNLGLATVVRKRLLRSHIV